MEVKPIGDVVEKFARRASGAAGDYAKGVKDTKKDWASSTAAAEEAYEAGVTAAIGRKAFGKGVKEAGDSKWRSNAAAKGATRYPEGIRLGVDDYRMGVEPYLAILASLTLPPRGARGSDGNYERVRLVGQALHKKRIGG